MFLHQSQQSFCEDTRESASSLALIEMVAGSSKFTEAFEFSYKLLEKPWLKLHLQTPVQSATIVVNFPKDIHEVFQAAGTGTRVVLLAVCLMVVFVQGSQGRGGSPSQLLMVKQIAHLPVSIRCVDKAA